MDVARKEITLEQREGLVSAADWEYLSHFVSEGQLGDLLQVLAACEPAVADAIVREARDGAEAFGDRSVLLALARVAATNSDFCDVSGPES